MRGGPNRHIKNKISTPSYFIKRLKDNKIGVYNMFKGYSDSDPRKWSVIVDPGVCSVMVTCYENHTFGEYKFELDDGGQLLPRNTYIVTPSIEVIIDKLFAIGVIQRAY